MKQVFQMIPRGSSNTKLQDMGVEKKMRKHCLVAIMIAILVGSFGLLRVSANISVSDGYVKPGDSVDLVFTGTPGSGFTITVSGSRNTMDNVSLVFDGTGQYTWSYRVNETSYTDSIKVRATIDGALVESGFIVSRMQPQQLAETMRIMAGNSKKQAESALIEAKRAGKLEAETLTRYRNAAQLLADSRSYAEQGEHTRAFEAIKTALAQFETIIDETYSTDTAPTASQNEKNRIRAQEVLKDLTDRLIELNRTARNLENNGFNVEAMDAEINRMQDGLEKAQDAVDSNNMGEAAQIIGAVDEHLKKVQEAITQRTREHNQRKVSSYQTSLANRYNTMRNTLTTLQSLNSDKVSIVLADMNSIEGKLDTARSLYQGGDITGSIRALQMADRDFKEAFARINGEETRTLMNILDHLTSQLENEPSQTNRLRLRRRIQNAKDSLASKLGEDIPEPTRPIPGATNDSLSPTLTP